MKKQKQFKNTNLKWVYPPNKWRSNSNKTFIYGWSNPKAKLLISLGAGLKPAPTKVKIFPNGNFAKSIKLPYKKNVVRLIQILNGKKKTISRHVIASTVGAKQSRSFHKRPGLLRQPFGLPRNDMTIVIDPGHGGKEHGTHSPKGIPEKVFNLQIAKLIYKRLKRKFKIVFLTRTTDKFVSLKDRINFAKSKKCDILISIHHNALPDNKNPIKHMGIGVYYTHNFVKPLANKLLKSISKESGLKQYGVFKRNFALTKPDFCSAILIECGFLTHPIEAELIIQKNTQEKIVKGISKILSLNSC